MKGISLSFEFFILGICLFIYTIWYCETEFEKREKNRLMEIENLAFRRESIALKKKIMIGRICRNYYCNMIHDSDVSFCLKRYEPK